jgi:hypothetical protein
MISVIASPLAYPASVLNRVIKNSRAERNSAGYVPQPLQTVVTMKNQFWRSPLSPYYESAFILMIGSV